MNTKPIAESEVRGAIERGLLAYLILLPCQQLAKRLPPGGELDEIIEQLRAAMTEMVADADIETAELAVPIGTHAAEILAPMERNTPVANLLSALYLVRTLVQSDRFTLDAGSPFDVATVRLIALLERDYAASWDANERAARRRARALHVSLIRRGLFG